MLNNRARVRLSEPLDLTRFPSKAQLLTVASGRGWFVAIKRSSSTGLSAYLHIECCVLCFDHIGSRRSHSIHRI